MNYFSVFFCGDFAPVRRFEPMVLEIGENVFGNLREDIANADLSLFNLECPLSFQGDPIKKNGPNLRAHPACIQSVANAGFLVAGLANNHILDFGPAALRETIDVCKGAGLIVCGAGENLQDARQPLTLEIGGAKISVLAYAENEFGIARKNQAGAAPLDPIENTYQIENARASSDFLFVTIHGGNEYFSFPRPGLRKLAMFYLDHGADAIICHHPHVPGAYEIYDGKPIIYSLGNLIFDHPSPPDGWEQGYGVRFEYSLRDGYLSSIEFVPFNQTVEGGGVSKIEEAEKKDFLEELGKLSQVLENETIYQNVWEDYCREKEMKFLLKQYVPFHFKGIGRLIKTLSLEKFYMPESTMEIRKNMVFCESHLEVLKFILDKRLSN